MLQRNINLLAGGSVKEMKLNSKFATEPIIITCQGQRRHMQPTHLLVFTTLLSVITTAFLYSS